MNTKQRDFKVDFDQINCVDIEAVDYPIEIFPVDKEKIKVIFTGLSNIDVISSEINDHAFVLRHTLQRGLRSFFGFLYRKGKIIVELPKNYHGNIKIKTCNGSIRMNEVFEGKEVTLMTVNGSIHVYGLKCSTALFSTRNSSIEIEQIVADQMTFDTRNGSIKGMIMGNICDFNIESHTVNGSNNLPTRMISSNRKKSIFAKTCNGRIAVDFMSL